MGKTRVLVRKMMGRLWIRVEAPWDLEVSWLLEFG